MGLVAAARARWGGAVLILVALLVAAGYFPDLRGEGTVGLGPIVAIDLLGALIVLRLLEAASRSALGDDFELGAALVVALYVLFEMTGGPRSPAYPLLYGLIALLVSVERWRSAVPQLLLALLLELLLARVAMRQGLARPRAQTLVGWHLFLMAGAALLYSAVLRLEVLRQRREQARTLGRALASLRAGARDFRLLAPEERESAQGRSRQEDEERLVLGAVQAIHDAVALTLTLLKRSLGLHSCLLLWLDEEGDAGARLTIKERVTDSTLMVDGPLDASAGAPGTVVKSGRLVNLADPKRGHLPYYLAPGPAAVSAFLGVPVAEEGALRGVLVADRADGEQFSSREERLFTSAAEQLLHVLKSERAFSAVERRRHEQERFFAAMARLNRALTAEEVYATSFEASREICAFDWAAITLYEPGSRRHTVAGVVGAAPRGLAGLSFGDNAGIAAMVIKNRHPLPAGGALRDREACVFTKQIRLEGIESLLVLPLISRDAAVGSFTVAARRPGAFGDAERERLSVIAGHVAVKLTNAQLYDRMEAMATTDGLTGLITHRTFQERFAEMLARGERTGACHALLLTDIDHFKRVNDTYGHPTGDLVLRGVAEEVRGCVRKIDLAARYGGEEFAIVLEGTDLAGARQLAERIRTEVEAQRFASPKGPFSCTLSLGIAVYPNDGRDPKTLIDRADQALYHAKHSGRNRAVAYVDLPPPSLLAAGG